MCNSLHVVTAPTIGAEIAAHYGKLKTESTTPEMSQERVKFDRYLLFYHTRVVEPDKNAIDFCVFAEENY